MAPKRSRMPRDLPDIILMDLVMPVMDGVEATRQIMAATPCPILLVTSSVTGNLNQVYAAMGHGGLDAVNTPIFGLGGVVQEAEPMLSRIAKLVQQANQHGTPGRRGDGADSCGGSSFSARSGCEQSPAAGRAGRFDRRARGGGADSICLSQGLSGRGGRGAAYWV